MTIIFRGTRKDTCTGIQVFRNDLTFHPGPSQQVWNHSPDGFNWGYGGSGPAQLALALLLDVTGDAELATSLHQQFKREFVATLDDDWQITADRIKEWVRECEK